MRNRRKTILHIFHLKKKTKLLIVEVARQGHAMENTAKIHHQAVLLEFVKLN